MWCGQPLVAYINKKGFLCFNMGNQYTSNQTIPSSITKSVAELVGVILGDGYIHKSQYSIVVYGSLEDKYYYTNHLIPLIEKTFQISVNINKHRTRNSYYFSINRKAVMNFFLDEVGMKRGNKKNVSIPNSILSNPFLYPRFLRGLFDTDGSLKFSKQTKDKRYYPRIQFCFKNTPMPYQLALMFKKLNFRFGKWTDRGQIYYYISGSDYLEKWAVLVGFGNPVHFTKYLVWKKLGYCPVSTMSERETILNQ